MTWTWDAGELDRFLGDLVRSETRLYNALDDLLRRRHGLVTSQYEFLRFVGDHPTARVADLATEFAIGVGATSRAADRLQARGWLDRTAHPRDRRASVLRLTTAGRRLVDEAGATSRGELDRLLAASVDREDLAAAARVLAALRSTLEQEGLGLPAG